MTEINWPAILIHSHQDELIYLESNTDWQIESQQTIDISSQLIDSSGRCYLLGDSTKGGLGWKMSTEGIKLEELIEKIGAHASLLGYCCSAKLGAKDFPQAFEIMRYLENEI